MSIDDINLDVVNEFFQNHSERDMPPIVRDLILSGTVLTHGNLKTYVMERKTLMDIYSPKISQEIGELSRGYNIPIVRSMQEKEFFVYHPHTGKYLGRFSLIGTNMD